MTKKVANRDDNDEKDDKEQLRKSFTPNWEETVNRTDGLPIKFNGKVLPNYKIIADSSSVDDEESLQEDIKESTDGSITKPTKKTKNPSSAKATTKMVKMNFDSKSPQELKRLRSHIAEVCFSITADPSNTFKTKRAHHDNSSGDPQRSKYSILDLLQLLRSSDAVEFEIAMLSDLIVFKDVCPGYRIRSAEELAKEGGEVQLKKETKALRDFESSLLKAYKMYLVVLQERVVDGLGVDFTKPVAEQLGLTALRCQCELLR
eukprot:gene37623-50791_t